MSRRCSDGLEIRQHATEPAVVHIEHAAAVGLFTHDILGLFFGADEQDGAALGGQVADEVKSGAEHLDRLLEVDDVDAVAGAEDVRFHLRIPAAGLVAEVNAGLEQLLHADFGHRGSSLFSRFAVSRR